jgi:O-antigen ligase
LVITFSRSAWLALAVGIIGFLFWHLIIRKKFSRKFLSGLIIVVVAATVSVVAFSSAVFTRLEATERLEEKSFSERTSEYQIIGEVIKENPFVGVGPGAYTIALAKLYPDQPVWSYQPMHNSFLLFFAETGLLGLVFLVYFLYASFNVLAPFSARTSLIQVIPLVAALTTLALFDHYLWSQWAGLALVAVVLAVFARRLEEN